MRWTLTEDDWELLRKVDTDFAHQLSLHNDASLNCQLMAEIIAAVRQEKPNV